MTIFDKLQNKNLPGGTLPGIKLKYIVKKSSPVPVCFSSPVFTSGTGNVLNPDPYSMALWLDPDPRKTYTGTSTDSKNLVLVSVTFKCFFLLDPDRILHADSNTQEFSHTTDLYGSG